MLSYIRVARCHDMIHLKYLGKLIIEPNKPIL